MGTGASQEQVQDERLSAQHRAEVKKLQEELDKQISDLVEQDRKRVRVRTMLDLSIKAKELQKQEIDKKLEENKSQLEDSSKLLQDLIDNKDKASTEIEDFEKQLAKYDTQRLDIHGKIAVEKSKMERFESERGVKGAKLIVAVGPTGYGKSSFCNRFTGDKSEYAETGKFDVDSSEQECTFESVTQEIRKVTYQHTIKSSNNDTNDNDNKEKNETLLCTIVDTPGTDDSDNKDEQNNDELIRYLRCCGGINAFLIFFDVSQLRISQNYQTILKNYEKMLGKGAWKHVIVMATKADAYLLSKRRVNWEKVKDNIREMIIEKLGLEDIFISPQNRDNDGKDFVKVDTVTGDLDACDENKFDPETGTATVGQKQVNGKIELPVIICDTMKGYDKSIDELLQIIKSIDKYDCDALECKLTQYETEKETIEKDIKEIQTKLREKRAKLAQMEAELRFIEKQKQEMNETENKLTNKCKSIQESLMSDIITYCLLNDRKGELAELLETDGKETEQESKERACDKDNIIPCPKCNEDDEFIIGIDNNDRQTKLVYRRGDQIYTSKGGIGYENSTESIVCIAYAPSCDYCDKKIGQLEYVYHCPNGKNEKHKYGFDVCTDCAVVLGAPKEDKIELQTGDSKDDQTESQKSKDNGATSPKFTIQDLEEAILDLD